MREQKDKEKMRVIENVIATICFSKSRNDKYSNTNT